MSPTDNDPTFFVHYKATVAFFVNKTPVSFSSLSDKAVFPKETNIYFLSVHRLLCLQKSIKFCIILLGTTY